MNIPGLLLRGAFISTVSAKYAAIFFVGIKNGFAIGTGIFQNAIISRENFLFPELAFRTGDLGF